MQELPSLLIAAAVFGLLVMVRVKVFQFRAAATGEQFHFGSSLRMMLRVLSSLVVPGAGQAMRGSDDGVLASRRLPCGSRLRRRGCFFHQSHLRDGARC